MESCILYHPNNLCKKYISYIVENVWKQDPWCQYMYILQRRNSSLMKKRKALIKKSLRLHFLVDSTKFVTFSTIFCKKIKEEICWQEENFHLLFLHVYGGNKTTSNLPTQITLLNDYEGPNMYKYFLFQYK